jgi:hypothetical protein
MPRRSAHAAARRAMKGRQRRPQKSQSTSCSPYRTCPPSIPGQIRLRSPTFWRRGRPCVLHSRTRHKGKLAGLAGGARGGKALTAAIANSNRSMTSLPESHHSPTWLISGNTSFAIDVRPGKARARFRTRVPFMLAHDRGDDQRAGGDGVGLQPRASVDMWIDRKAAN